MTPQLSFRTQRVGLTGQSSEWASSVPKGSILGRLLFLIHSFDIVNQIVINIHLFADDIILYVTVETPTAQPHC